MVFERVVAVLVGLVAGCAARPDAPPSAPMIDTTAPPVASALPAGHADPIPPPDPEPASPRIAGSTWQFCGQAKDTVTFEADGRVP